jgi:multidrug efflux system outer membrane protein
MALAGCVNLAPKYERPAAPVAAAFPTVEGTVHSGNPVAPERRPASPGSASSPTPACSS